MGTIHDSVGIPFYFSPGIIRMATKHFNIRVYGRVQGVFFRASARSHADHLDLKGFAQNENDGSVYIEAEGEEENISKFIEWCHRGPERAEVEKVEVEEGPVMNFTTFDVNRGMY